MKSTGSRSLGSNSDEKTNAGTKLIEEESAEVGKVGWAVYKYYAAALGALGVAFAVITRLLAIGADMSTGIWLTIWTQNQLGNATVTSNRDMYLGVYAALGITQAIVLMIMMFGMAIFRLNAGKKLHNSMLSKIMKAPMSFFDTTPVGRILNRFSKDVTVGDQQIGMTITSLLDSVLRFGGYMIFIVIQVPLSAAAIIPIVIIFYFLQKVYIRTSRQTNRLESISNSPIFSHFEETLNGTTSIRAYKWNQLFITQSQNKVDSYQKCMYTSKLCERWLNIRLNFMGNFIIFFICLFALLQPANMNASIIGLVITYAFTVTDTLGSVVKEASDLESQMVAVERMREYSKDIAEEADWEIEETKPKSDWPGKGDVVF